MAATLSLALTAADVESAAARVGSRVRETPVLRVETGGLTAWPLVLKLELFQHTGSFKPRGAFNRVLAGGVTSAGVIAASGGNHGLAVAHVARELGVPAEIFVPASSPPGKVDGIAALGARVVVGGAFYADAYAAMLDRAAAGSALVVHAYDMAEVVAGQGLVGRELLAQVPEVDTVLVAVGGGGLIGGITLALGAAARVVAVEPAAIPTMHAALSAGRPVDVAVSGVAADSLGARRIGELGFAIARDAGVASILVDDAAITAARRRLWERCRIAAEPGGATALAACTSGAYRPSEGECVAVVVCGGNTDVTTLAP